MSVIDAGSNTTDIYDPDSYVAGVPHATVPTIERTGPVRRTRSNLNNALKSLPVQLVR
jgi:hypothetical protein